MRTISLRKDINFFLTSSQSFRLIERKFMDIHLHLLLYREEVDYEQEHATFHAV